MPENANQRVARLVRTVQAEVGQLVRAERDRRVALREWLRSAEGEDRAELLAELGTSHGTEQGLLAALEVIERAAAGRRPTG
jgi:hypothetical protein